MCWNESVAGRMLCHYAFRRALLHEAEPIAGDAALLNFFRAFSDAIAVMMAIDVFKRLAS